MDQRLCIADMHTNDRFFAWFENLLNWKYTYLDLDICHFYVAQNTKYLNMIFFACFWDK
jgi:hypothetical protein